jgi:outer membrane protein
MLKMKFAASTLGVIAAFAISVAAQQPASAAAGSIPDGKIAVVNTGVFPAQISELKLKYDQVENQLKDRYQKLQSLDQQLKQMETDLQTKAPQMTPEKQREMQETYDRLKKQGSRDFEDFKSDYDRALETATSPIRQKLLKFMETYAQQRGIVMIINLPGAAQAGALAYWHPGTDVTEDFVAQYNKANPVAAPAGTPPASKPNAAKPGANK